MSINVVSSQAIAERSLTQEMTLAYTEQRNGRGEYRQKETRNLDDAFYFVEKMEVEYRRATVKSSG